MCIKLTTQAEQSGDIRIQLCIEWRSHDNVLSTIHNWMDLAKNNSEFDVVAMRTDSSVLEREEDHRKEIIQRGPEMIAIRTPQLTRICIHSGLDIVKNGHEWRRGNCTQLSTNPMEMPRKQGCVLPNRDRYRRQAMKRERERECS